jgi:hypothetical protein
VIFWASRRVEMDRVIEKFCYEGYILNGTVLASSHDRYEHDYFQLPSGTNPGEVYALYWMWNTTRPLQGGFIV